MVVKVISHDTSTVIMEPGKVSFYLPSSFVPTKLSTILSFRFFPVFSMWADQFNSNLSKFLTQWITVISTVCDQVLWTLFNMTNMERILYQFHFMSVGSGGPYGERKTSSVCDCHDLGALATLSFSDMIPPFLALEKVPSIKHSSMSISPSSFRC